MPEAINPPPDWDAMMRRAEEIRTMVDSGSPDSAALFDEYCQIFKAGVIDAEDLAWAQRK